MSTGAVLYVALAELTQIRRRAHSMHDSLTRVDTIFRSHTDPCQPLDSLIVAAHATGCGRHPHRILEYLENR